MSTAIRPVHQEDRIWVMDALRGFAILGIFIANLSSGFAFYAPGDGGSAYISAADGTVEFLNHMLIEGKFYSIFSFLFGWGMALQLQRSELKGIEPVKLVRRRLLFMFLLGLAHIIILWPGDIVAFYALVGFLLLLVRKWERKKMLITAIVLLLLPIPLYYLKMKWPAVFNYPSTGMQQLGYGTGYLLTGISSEEQYLAYLKTLTFWDNMKLNTAALFFRFSDLFFQSRIFKVLGMFMLGMLMGRHYKAVFANRKLLWTVAVAGLLIGIPANYMLANMNIRDYYNLQPSGIYRTIYYAAGVAPMALSYTALFLLFSFTSGGRSMLSVLAPAGKMAFTNYIIHSIVGITVFQSFGFNMAGKVGPLYQVYFALIVFACQVALSHLWLKYFLFGPVEWLWRSATYGRWQQMKRRVEKNTAVIHKEEVIL